MNQSQKQYKIKIPFNTLPDKFNPLLRLNTICPYYTMFPLDFPFKALSTAKSNDWVLDPFCGRGTTNYAARLKGLPSVGIDSNPVATAIAQAKLTNAKPAKITKICKEIILQDSPPKDIPEGKFWDYCYHQSTLEQICKLREHFLVNCSTDEKIALRSLILGILHGPLRKSDPAYLSNQMPRTYSTKPNSAINFWEKRELYPPEIDVIAVVERKAKYLFSTLPPKCQGEILQTDSRYSFEREIPSKFKWIITSPPYFGMASYTQDQWLRKWFLGGASHVEYNQKNQIPHGSESNFIQNLSQVWKNVAEVCCKGAHLIIRFGSLPSLASDPALILEKSLFSTNGEWKIVDIEDAGVSPRGKRQAEQFKNNNLGIARSEIDLEALFVG